MLLPHGHARAKAQRKAARTSSSWAEQLPKAAAHERAQLNHAHHIFRQRHAVLAQAAPLHMLAEAPPAMRGHVIVCTPPLATGVLADLLTTLRAHLAPQRPIVLLCKSMQDKAWARISMFADLHVVRGSGLHIDHLWRAGVGRAAHVLVLSGRLRDAPADPYASECSSLCFCARAVADRCVAVATDANALLTCRNLFSHALPHNPALHVTVHLCKFACWRVCAVSLIGC